MEVPAGAHQIQKCYRVGTAGNSQQGTPLIQAEARDVVAKAVQQSHALKANEDGGSGWGSPAPRPAAHSAVEVYTVGPPFVSCCRSSTVVAGHHLPASHLRRLSLPSAPPALGRSGLNRERANGT